MTRATLAITLPDHVWITQVSTTFPDATFRILATVLGNESGFALVSLTGEGAPEIVESMNDHPQIAELTLVTWNEREATVHFETTTPLLLFCSREAGIPIRSPVEISDGEATVEATGSREQLSELTERLERFGFQFRVEQVAERFHEDRLLSGRQRELVLRAVERGYYDTPRRCSLSELADHLGIAKSTCSETLHRAEETIVKRFVEDLPGYDEGESPEEKLSVE